MKYEIRNMKWGKCAAAVTIFSFTLHISHFTFADVGTTSAQFLELPVGARAIAMGSAQGAVSGDASGLYFNPATLSTLEGGNITFMHAGYFEESAYQCAALSQNLGRFGTWGLGVQRMTYGEFQDVDNTGQILGTTFSPNDLGVTLGVGKSFNNRTDGGVAVKYISSKIKASASTMAYDFGLRFRANARWAFSASASNFGGGLQYQQVEDDLPQTFRLGSAYKTGRWVSAGDIVLPKGADAFAAIGTEYSFPLSASVLSVRAGYNTRHTDSELEGLAGMNVGLGVHFGRILIDYAFSPYGELGDVHRASVGFSWGGGHGSNATTPRQKKEKRSRSRRGGPLRPEPRQGPL
jgi:hypothetical protein